jgi:hypothetical protein
LLAPSRGLGLVDVLGREHRVGSRHEIEHVSQPVWSVDTPPAVGLQADAEAGGGCLERVDRRLSGRMRAAGDAELLLVPQVHPGLIADLDGGRQASEDLIASLDDRILRFPGQVGIVEVTRINS